MRRVRAQRTRKTAGTGLQLKAAEKPSALEQKAARGILKSFRNPAHIPDDRMAQDIRQTRKSQNLGNKFPERAAVWTKVTNPPKDTIAAVTKTGRFLVEYSTAEVISQRQVSKAEIKGLLAASDITETSDDEKITVAHTVMTERQAEFMAKTNASEKLRERSGFGLEIG